MKLDFYDLDVIRLALNYFINTNDKIHPDWIKSAEWLRKRVYTEQERLVNETRN